MSLGLGSTQARRAQRDSRSRNPSSKPFRTHGKVFFTLGGLDYVCSGTSIKSKTKSLVVTAGHCTYSEADGYASNFMFVPAYDNGNEPFGEWTAKRIKATPQWEENEDIRYDVGMATMSKLNGKKLGERRRLAQDRLQQGPRPELRRVRLSRPRSRSTARRCIAATRRPRERTTSRTDPKPTRIDCDMTGGSSGGGWVIDGGKVNSVVSYGYECVDPAADLREPRGGEALRPLLRRRDQAALPLAEAASRHLACGARGSRDMIRSRRGSVDESTCFMPAAIAGWTLAIRSCMAWATAR